MTPNLSALEADVVQAQTYLNERLRSKQAASAALATAVRPAGIPASWLPDFGPNLVVRAWFDPSHFGPQLTTRN